MSARPRTLRLGSGGAAARGCGKKAELLDRAARAGLPVPAGVIVTHEAWVDSMERRLTRLEGHGGRMSVAVPDPPALVRFLDLEESTGRLAVRSAFSSEDGSAESLAGWFASGLFVDGRTPFALAAALAGVWASAFRRPGRFRHDVIVQAMVESRRAGVAFTEPGFEDDLVNAAFGTADGLLSGRASGDTFTVPRLCAAERASEENPVLGRLQLLLRDVRAALGEDDWDVEWADDGRRCWLVQVRPVTRPTRRNDAFTAATHREILPDPPSRFMTSVVAASAGRLFGSFRRFDAGLTTRRPLVEVFRGRPFLNLSLLADVLRRWGLPTRLLTDSIGGRTDRDFGLRPLRLARRLPVLGRLGLAQLAAAGSARRLEAAIRGRTAFAPSRLSEAVAAFQWLYSALATEMVVLTAAMAAPLALLRRAGVLDEVGAGWRSEMLDDLAALQRLAAGRESVRAALERGEVPEDPAFRHGLEEWLAKHGHRGVYESDPARPRYREDPTPLLRSLASGSLSHPPRPPRSVRAILLAPLAWQAGRALRARERLRSTAMVGFERLRRAMLEHAGLLVGAGVLPAAEAVWSLEVSEALRIDAGFRPDATFWRLRREEEASLREYDLPDLFHRFDDLEAHRRRPEGQMAPVRLRGIPLTAGVLEGRAWVLAGPSVDRPPGLRREGTILVARAADAGWIPTFALVAGVVVETGGDLSHGSIVLREMGLPAVTNVAGATRAFKTGDGVRLRADEGTVERLGG
ncbi:MAG TPA: PEP-utilizing enzyme [Vicinamibacteria bacterium]|nr:PEP-utilizing enzyme [Vicinamibacteria bacterium]